jgi:hypothetical protein
VDGHEREKMGDPMAIDKKIMDQLLTTTRSPRISSERTVCSKSWSKPILERALQAERTDVLRKNPGTAIFQINVTRISRLGLVFSLQNIADCKEVQSVQNFGELQSAAFSGLAPRRRPHQP